MVSFIFSYKAYFMLLLQTEVAETERTFLLFNNTLEVLRKLIMEEEKSSVT